MTRFNASICRSLDALLGEERDQFGSQVDEASSLLNELVIDMARLNKVKRLDAQARLISSYLFREQAFRFRLVDRSEDFSLSRTLLTRSGNCLGLTTLYYAVASSSGIAISPLLFESHIAACLGQDAVPVIELSRGGLLLSESMARRMYRDLAGRVLSACELRAVHLSNRAAFVMVPQAREREALTMLDCALQLFPDYTGGRINRTALLLRMQRWDEASSELGRVWRCNLGAQYRRVANLMLRQLIQGTKRSSMAAIF